MRIRIAASAALVAAAALLTLTACSDDDKSSSPPASSAPAATSADTGGGDSTASSDPSANSDSGGSSGMDPATRDLLISSLRRVDPSLADNPEQTATSAQEQCDALANGSDPDGHAAAEKFSTPDHQLTDVQGQAIDAALNALVCEPDLGG